jgi:hypothetical protein
VGSHIRGMSLLWQGGAAARGAHQRRVAGALQREAPARLLRKRAHRCEHVDQAVERVTSDTPIAEAVCAFCPT